MKLTMLFLTATALMVSAKSSSQAITFAGKDVPIEKVFTIIEQQTGFVFFYNQPILADAKPVTIKAVNTPLESFLKQVFRNQPLKYLIENKTIVVSRKPVSRSIFPFFMQEEEESPTVAVNGILTGAEGVPLAGSTITNRNTRDVTYSNIQGRFTLNAEPGHTIIISHVGYETKEFRLTSDMIKTTLLVRLTQTVSILDQVQIIGYGQTTRRFSTGSVSTVKAEEIEKQPVNNVLMALQGQVPGMLITQSSGLPGGGFRVEIRGRNSINTSGQPLYIIDGVPYPGGQVSNNGYILNDNLKGGDMLNFLDMSNIESVDVLKDADATAIYGSRGANGVVLITTKKGKAGRTRFTVEGYTGAGKLTALPTYLNTQQYLEMRREAKRNDNAAILPTEYDINGVWDTTRYTNFQKEFLNNPARYNDIKVSTSGGNDNTSFLLSGGYHKETTVFPGSGGVERGAANFNFNHTSPGRRFTASLSGSFVVDYNTVNPAGMFLILGVTPPDAPVIYKEDGSLNFENNTFSNPYLSLRQLYKSNTNNLVMNSTLGYRILTGLDAKVMLGLVNTQFDNFYGSPAAAQLPTNTSFIRSAEYINSRFKRWSIEPQLTYSKKIAQADIDALAGVTWQQSLDRRTNLTGSGFSSDQLLESIFNAPNVVASDGTYAKYKYNGVFSRLELKWAQKYILKLSGRFDGSSKFGPDKQFNFFGGIGGAWIFTEEPLVKKIVPFMSFGKLKASYGTSGSDALQNYQFMELYRSFPYSYQNTLGLYPSNLFNPDLSWELSKKLDLGAELGFFKDRISIEAVYYNNRSTSQLITFNLSAVTGFTGIVRNMDAVIQNRGVEIQVNTINIRTKHFTWRTSFNIASSRNKLLSVPGGSPLEGQPLNLTNLYNYAGVDPQTGLFNFYDTEGKRITNPQPKDRTVWLQTDPRYYGGFSNTVSWKGLSLDFFFYFKKQLQRTAIGSSILPSGLAYNVVASEVLGRWQKPGDITDIQKFSQNFSTFNTHAAALQSTRVWGEGSFMRLRNVALTYAFNQALLKKVHMQSLRVFVRGENLLLITSYKDFDPEIGPGNVPPVKVLTAGIQFTF